MKIELSVACDQIEDMLQAHYNLADPVKLTGMDYDEKADLCAFEFEVESEDCPKINRNWDDWAFTEGLIEDAI